jgi:hypothetical protein
MFEQPEAEPETTGVDQEVESQGGEGAQNAEAAPSIGQEAEPDETVTPALEGDVGVPPDEEMNRPEE